MALYFIRDGDVQRWVIAIGMQLAMEKFMVDQGSEAEPEEIKLVACSDEVIA